MLDAHPAQSSAYRERGRSGASGVEWRDAIAVMMRQKTDNLAARKRPIGRKRGVRTRVLLAMRVRGCQKLPDRGDRLWPDSTLDSTCQVLLPGRILSWKTADVKSQLRLTILVRQV